MNVDPIAVARSCYDAYAANDRQRMESLLAADFRFTSPVDNRIDRATFFERCWPTNIAMGSTRTATPEAWSIRSGMRATTA